MKVQRYAYEVLERNSANGVFKHRGLFTSFAKVQAYFSLEYYRNHTNGEVNRISIEGPFDWATAEWYVTKARVDFTFECESNGTPSREDWWEKTTWKIRRHELR